MYHTDFNGYYFHTIYYLLFSFLLIKLTSSSLTNIHQVNEAVFINPETNSATIRCPLDLKHDFNIQWYDAINNRYETDHQGYYHINGVEPYDRELICSSVSRTGIEEDDQYRIKIRMYDRPLPIRHVAILHRTNTTLTLQWKEENYNRNANISYYELILRHNHTIKSHVLVNHTQTTYTFASLQPHTLYSIEISVIDIWQRSSQSTRTTERTLRKNENFSSHKLIDRQLLHQSISCYHINHELLLIELNRSRFLTRNPIYNLTIYNNEDHVVLVDNLYSAEQSLPLMKTLNSFIYDLKDNSVPHKIKLAISTMRLEFLGLILKYCEDFYPIYSPLTCSIKPINQYEYQLMINTYLHNSHKHIMTLKPNYVFYQANKTHVIQESIDNIHKYITANISDVAENYSVILKNNLIGSDKHDKLNITILCSISRIVPVNQTSKATIGFIIIIILFFIIVAILVALIVYRKRVQVVVPNSLIDQVDTFRKNRNACFVQINDSSIDNAAKILEKEYQEYDSKPIPIYRFPAYVAYLHKDSDFGFIRLFENICESSKANKFPASVAQIEYNQWKNRYVNILTYDHSRVKLSDIENNEKETYINANYIDGFEKANVYIATQGPMINTMNDFWKMIWEKDVSVLVMITNIKECGRVKCDIYWPQEGAQTYGTIQVTLVRTISLAYYIKRVFLIRSEANDQLIDCERLVHQFHFTNWPDHGVPSFTLPVLSFIRRSSACSTETNGPIVVHCSAGVGRTGTYIVIDTMLKKINKQQSIDIPNFLKHIRQQRNFLVQNEEQFIFIYDVLSEAVQLLTISEKSLELNEHNIDDIMQTLDELDKDSNLRQIEKQFQSIVEQEITAYGSSSVEKMKENSSKNRNQAILPLDACRVVLSTYKRLIPGYYINASYIHGYYRVNEFIITQHPMMNTKGDFWQMIWDSNANVIVSLYAEEKSQPDVPDFWPAENQILNCGGFFISLIDENFDSDYVYRDFSLRSIEGNRELKVKLISCSYWPDTCSPVKVSFDIINKVRDLKTNRPIVVHDLFGGHRAAIFCALYTMHEQIEIEGVLNVYELARIYHLKRPGIWRCYRIQMIVTELNIPCVWGGTLAGILLQSDVEVTDRFNRPTTKIIGIHGWLDNLNSLLPISKKLIEHNPTYEIYLYDRAGHGFSNHLPKGSDYSYGCGLEDVREVIKTLGWQKEKFSIIGHSFGAMLGMTYATCYQDEVLCVVAIDAMVRAEVTTESFWTTVGHRIDYNLNFLNTIPSTYTDELTLEKAIAHTKSGRPGITDEAARLLIERAVRRDGDNKLYFTRDPSLKMASLIPFSVDMVESVVRTIKVSILLIGANDPQYPRAHQALDLFKQHVPNFEVTLIDGPHHLHMTHVDKVVERIEQYFDKYLKQTPTRMIINSKL
ncbi:unnamed protein product [Rotaria magnacalcarata]|uniref:Protein-tyrosine-phosphatase n=8 Tax=Rotaria magnacalcarata TaxID=392030 RepID=A0A815QRR4_9BILA|nr:unnamed protein product [Rotaria magnacalcarata]CAF1619893.1 unnamed protein product [Rotaria magnacalcarata]